LALFISAYYIWQLVKKHQIADWKVKLLPLSVLLIAVGSTTYHTFRSPYTMLMDVAPIYLFFLVFFYLFIKKFVKTSAKALFTTPTFAATLLVITIATPREFLNGSIRHFFNAATLLGMGLVAVKKFGPQARGFFSVFIIYSLAIFFRTIEPVVCLHFPVGTHFTWHILTAVSAYYAVKALLIILKSNHA